MSPVCSRPFGQLPDGRNATLYTLTNNNGINASISDYGATLVSINCPDNKGQFGDIIVGYDNVETYVKSTFYMGSIIGRFGNRIANGQFELDGKRYTLDTNNGPNHLHGGLDGFDSRLWQAQIASDGRAAVSFTLISNDGDQGYPGQLNVQVTYWLDEHNCLHCDMQANTNKACPVSLTNHAYFNLAGQGTIDQHLLQLNCDFYTPTDSTCIPTGEIADVSDSPFDFRQPRKIGERINDTHEQIQIGAGYDHNFVTKTDGNNVVHIATISEASCGRQLRISSNAPGAQLYSANYLNGSLTGKGQSHLRRNAVCLEPQHFPDSPNKPQFPNSILRPGETYLHSIRFEMGLC